MSCTNCTDFTLDKWEYCSREGEGGGDDDVTTSRQPSWFRSGWNRARRWSVGSQYTTRHAELRWWTPIPARAAFALDSKPIPASCSLMLPPGYQKSLVPTSFHYLLIPITTSLPQLCYTRNSTSLPARIIPPVTNYTSSP